MRLDEEKVDKGKKKHGLNVTKYIEKLIDEDLKYPLWV